MFYVSNDALISAIKRLRASGTHESFRVYLTLKAHGLRYGNQEYIPVTTGNVIPALNQLFYVQGLSTDKPFYSPLRNELLKEDHGRGVIQTSVKKYIDEATKTKMKWLEGYRGNEGAEKPWYVRFSAQYPSTLGSGEAGLAAKDEMQISIHAPSFVLWMNRDAEFSVKPTFDELWADVQVKLNLEPVEADLLFVGDAFETDPFTKVRPARSELVSFILKEAGRGSGRDVLTTPERSAFSQTKIRRIMSSYSDRTNDQSWLSVRNLKDEALSVLEETRALLLVGPPGTGKTRLALALADEIVGGDEKRKHLFQFHASYAYEDFIQALTPKPEGAALKFVPVIKRFAQACEAANKQKQVVILDELNRADVSKVFGEAFFLIERGYRDEKYAIPYIYDPEKRFWIPPDLYVIATLNDLDKSTYDLDFAFRRRFGQVDVKPSADELEQILRAAGCADKDFILMLRSAFNEINDSSSKEHGYPLGHAYFKNVKDRETLKNAYRRVIRPTIQAYLGEYRRGDLEKADSIFKRVVDAGTLAEYYGSPEDAVTSAEE